MASQTPVQTTGVFPAQNVPLGGGGGWVFSVISDYFKNKIVCNAWVNETPIKTFFYYNAENFTLALAETYLKDNFKKKSFVQ